jgi:hypothetical protein
MGKPAGSDAGQSAKIGSSGQLANGWMIFAAICLFTLFVRLPEFGNPAPDFDEQLYFLVGDRMWDGAVPFVDIWDRKPIGLFLIYAAIRMLGGDGIIQYQLVAAAFVAATAFMVHRITTRFTGYSGSLSAACIYIVYLRGFNSYVGQTESFLMLLCVGTMLLAIRSLETDDRVIIRNHALAAMLIMGAALQVKYTVLPQCVFFGLFFLWRLGTHEGYAKALLRHAAPFIALGLAPTALVAFYYAQIGQFEAFFYANFTSIFDRGRLTGESQAFFIRYAGLIFLPLGIVAMSAWLERRQLTDNRIAFATIAAWGLTCFLAVIMTGSLYIHYAVPIAPPLAILAGAFIGHATIRLTATAMLVFYVLFLTAYPAAFSKNQGDIEAIERMTTLLKPHVDLGCLYIYDGPSALYTTTGSCLPTRRPYPDHLNNLQEIHSMGLDQAAEVRRILENRPVAIVTANRPVVPKYSPEPKALVTQAIARDYRLITRQRYDYRTISVFLRNDLKSEATVPSQISRSR